MQSYLHQAVSTRLRLLAGRVVGCPQSQAGIRDSYGQWTGHLQPGTTNHGDVYTTTSLSGPRQTKTASLWRAANGPLHWVNPQRTEPRTINDDFDPVYSFEPCTL